MIVRVFDGHSEGGGAYRLVRIENPRRANSLSIEAMELLQRGVRGARAPIIVLAHWRKG